MGFSAVNTGNNLLYLIVALLLGFMATSGLVGWLNIRDVECELSFSDEIYCHTPTLVSLDITNRKRLMPSYLLDVQVAGQKRLFTSVPQKGTGKNSFIHTFNSRGRHSLTTATVSSPFPVNFFVRGMVVPVENEIIVFPAPAAAGINPFQAHTGSRGERFAAERGFDGEMRTIAEYTGVEPLKQIHWRLSARHDWFKVKELTATAAQPIILDLTAESSLPLEERLSWAVFIINKGIREDKAIGLRISSDKVIPPDKGRGHRIRMLRELALYE
ncbi:hypothetical protein OR1_02325 [Geobacter sp. OR-1]|uniref:DUF58 domain-containing protein n=1 Tax=Geobacter sp. OR-1 TaxID=1266765 RepID=UPI0005420130|nr:DUF58 domain-containing protein [Geobacter sp. OR-1]GAM10039.1 hypothetical protein OR1_02325 [Geobacter sp. OR-1]